MAFNYSGSNGKLYYTLNGVAKRVHEAYIGQLVESVLEPEPTVVAKLVYRGGADVYYHVDTNETHTEYKYINDNVVVTTSFTPTKTGYTFVGWRTDTVANSDVIQTMYMEGRTIDLYAVFSKDITLQCYMYNESAVDYNETFSNVSYYNNGNSTYPTFTVRENDMPNYRFVGWSLSQSQDGTIEYEHISNQQFTTSTTLYAIYQYSVHYGYAVNGSVATYDGVVAVNAINTTVQLCPIFTLADPERLDASFIGWSISPTSHDVTYYPISDTNPDHPKVDHIPINNNTIFYSVFKYADIQNIPVYASGSGVIQGSNTPTWIEIRKSDGTQLDSYSTNYFESAVLSGHITSSGNGDVVYFRDTFGRSKDSTGVFQAGETKDFSGVTISLLPGGSTRFCLATDDGVNAFVQCELSTLQPTNATLTVNGRWIVG